MADLRPPQECRGCGSGFTHDLKIRVSLCGECRSKKSRENASRQWKKKYEHIILTDRERQVLVGSVLGDGCITKSPSQFGNLGLTVTHGLKQDKYCRWKASLLERVISLVKVKTRKSGFGTGLKETRFNTCHLPQLTEVLAPYRDPAGKKVIPERVTEDVDLLGILVWYLDDGSLQRPKRLPSGKARDASIVLCTFSFSNQEIDFLKELLRQRCGVFPKDSVHTNRGRRYRGIRLYGDDVRRFVTIIRSVPGAENAGMNYKLPPPENLEVFWKRSKLSDPKVAALKQMFGADTESQAARKLGVSRKSVYCMIGRGGPSTWGPSEERKAKLLEWFGTSNQSEASRRSGIDRKEIWKRLKQAGA